MRIPKSKIYRAFSELDAFSDEDCGRFLRRAKIRRPLSRWLPRLSFLITVPLAFVSFGFLMYLFESEISGAFDAIDRALGIRLGGLDISSVLYSMLFVCWPVLIPVSVYWLWRDWLLRRLLRAAIDLAICANCRHSLLGLPLLPDRAPAVRCTECGAVMELAKVGLTPEDLIVGETRKKASVPEK